MPYGLLAPRGSRLAIWSLGASALLGCLLNQSTLQQLTLSEHTTVICLLPFVTAFMAWVWLSERFTRIQATCCSEFLKIEHSIAN
jgi:drug/metabolite transporter (DMT)-like permease